jgi:peptide chain release factor subunit 1
MCDSRFHVESLTELLQDDQKFGFIVMDGAGTLYGTVCGNHREVLHKFSVELPKKHGRGGQSAQRFGRIRMEKRLAYMKKVSELATQQFITADRPNVAGIILAGSAEFKSQLVAAELLDGRLAEIVISTVDVSYGGENGFNQAIELAAETLANVKFVAEKKLINSYFDEIAKDTGKYCFGVRDVMHALEMSAVETLILWEDLPEIRYELRNPSTGTLSHLILRPGQERDRSMFQDAETGVDLDVVDQMPLVEWLANNFKSFGAQLNFITDRSQEGSQLVRGFGGLAAILRWQVDFSTLDELEMLEGTGGLDDDDFM